MMAACSTAALRMRTVWAIESYPYILPSGPVQPREGSVLVGRATAAGITTAGDPCFSEIGR